MKKNNGQLPEERAYQEARRDLCLIKRLLREHKNSLGIAKRELAARRATLAEIAEAERVEAAHHSYLAATQSNSYDPLDWMHCLPDKA